MYYYATAYGVYRCAAPLKPQQSSAMADFSKGEPENQWMRVTFTMRHHELIGEGSVLDVIEKLSLEIQWSRSGKDLARCASLKNTLSAFSRLL